MKPEDAFTRQSRVRYNALRKALNKVTVPEGFVVIPGRQRLVSDVSELVYVEVRGAGRSEKFYFWSKPKRKEVKQIVELLVKVIQNG